MRFSKTELQILEQIAKGNKDIKQIATALKKSKAQIYRSGQKLIEKGFIVCSEGFYEAEKATHGTLLLQLLSQYPSIIIPLSDSGVEFFTFLLEPKTVSEMMQETGLKRTRGFRKLKQAKHISLLTRQNDRYSLNEKLWGKLKEFLIELKKYEETTDKRVPANSTIYFKTENEIIFSTAEKIEATKTAFSAYEQYGIKIFPQKKYYYLPNKKLIKEEVFRHSLYVAEKEPDTRHITFVALFYARYRKALSGIKHKIIYNINKIFEGGHIHGYPTLEEIKDRADVYDIKILRLEQAV